MGDKQLKVDMVTDMGIGPLSDEGSDSAASSSGQMLTPPASNYHSPINESAPEPVKTFISVSTTFFPGADNGESPLTDIIIVSTDSVFFYVHSRKLLAASNNRFNHLIPHDFEQNDTKEPDFIISIPESSVVINLLLHTLYGMSCSHYSPTLSELSSTLGVLTTHGISPDHFVKAGSPLFNTLRFHASDNAIELYTIAASHNVHDLAVSTSMHLLSLPLHSITDELAARMGTFYLKRLFFLHLGRAEALKRLLVAPPSAHQPTPDCDIMEQKKLTRAWALACAYLTWDVRVDLTVSTIESALLPLENQVSCGQCKALLRDRVKTFTMQWSLVKMTI